MRPMPPRMPIDTSATTAPMTALAAASRRAGSRYGTAVLGLAMAGLVAVLDAVMMRNRPKEATT